MGFPKAQLVPLGLRKAGFELGIPQYFQAEIDCHIEDGRYAEAILACRILLPRPP